MEQFYDFHFIETEKILLTIVREWTLKYFEEFIDKYSTRFDKRYFSILLILFIKENNLSRIREFMGFLLENGADPMFKSHKFDRALAYDVLSCKDLEVAIKFLDYMRDINATIDPFGTTALHLFTQHHTDVLLHLILKRKPNVNIRDVNGIRPLHQAALNTAYNKVKLLVSAGADVHARNGQNGNTPLHLALLNKTNYRGPDTIEFLTQVSNVRAKNTAGDTPLHLLVGGREPYVKRLCVTMLEKGADPNDTNHRGKTPLHYVLRLRYEDAPPACCDIVDIFLRYGAEINAQDSLGQTVLHVSADSPGWVDRCAEFLIFLMERGADPNVLDKHRRTILHLLRGEDITKAAYVIKYLAKREFCGKFRFGRELLDVIRFDKELGCQFNNCRNELSYFYFIKYRSIYSFTLFDVLNCSSAYMLARYTKNEDFRNTMSAFDASKFPIYGDDLKANFDLGKTRYEAQIKGSRFLAAASGGSLDQYCMDEIMKYIATEEFWKLELTSEDDSE